MLPTDFAAGLAWTRILQLSSDAWLGAVGDELFVGGYEAPRRRVDPARPTGLLPCLERPRSVVVAELRAREVELDLGEGALTELVPLGVIPVEAVVSELDYWVQLALDWLAETPDDSARRVLLASIEGASWATQRARHRAMKLRKAGGN
jgi:hypothetical protein